MSGLPLEGEKVISAAEMARIEGLAYKEGVSDRSFMENAGKAIAERTQEFVEESGSSKKVSLLVGKGNNGGDALAAGSILLERGYAVSAWLTHPLEECSPLCRAMHEQFKAHGGKVHFAHDRKSFTLPSDGVLLDGLVGTGFKGKAEGILAVAIEAANASGLPILAIDIPSGLNGVTGEVETVAIKATETIYLGLPKTGFYFNQGWDHVGTLRFASFGLSEKHLSLVKPSAYLFNEESMPGQLPAVVRTRHKYQAGYVLAIAGSPGMPGAALLSSFAALRSGAGIVRLFHPEGMEEELSGAPYELIRQGWDGKDFSAIEKEASRAKALLIGPGMGRTKDMQKTFQKVLEQISLPMVIDADGLYFLAENPSFKCPSGSILTPHRGEMERLLSKPLDKDPEGLLHACQSFVETRHVTLVLKGAPTFLFHPKHPPLIFTQGDPGMATAGSGDVLTGIIAAMLAQGLDSRRAAAVGVYLHGIAGEAAALNLTSYCVTASDLIDFLPDAFSACLS